MSAIAKLADHISMNIADSLKMDQEKTSVISYGIFCSLEILLSVALVIFFGLLFHVLIESLIISFSISILRKYAGGAHAGTPERCLAVGTVISVGPAVLIGITAIPGAVVAAVGLLLFLWSFWVVSYRAPVDSVNKPIRNPEKRKKLKIGSLIILGMELLLSAACICLFQFVNLDQYLKYTECMLFGIAWQVFTLTKTGHFILNTIDSKIIFWNRRGGERNEE